MPFLRKDPPPGEAAERKRRQLPLRRLALGLQFAVVAAFAAAMMNAPKMPEAAPEEALRRVRYEVTQEEWPTRPTLRRIQDRYGGNLAAMQLANERGACADPDAPIDYGETIYIEFSTGARRCNGSAAAPGL